MKKGFGLVEPMILIAIVGILATMFFMCSSGNKGEPDYFVGTVYVPKAVHEKHFINLHYKNKPASVDWSRVLSWSRIDSHTTQIIYTYKDENGEENLNYLYADEIIMVKE